MPLALLPTQGVFVQPITLIASHDRPARGCCMRASFQARLVLPSLTCAWGACVPQSAPLPKRSGVVLERACPAPPVLCCLAALLAHPRRLAAVMRSPRRLPARPALTDRWHWVLLLHLQFKGEQVVAIRKVHHSVRVTQQGVHRDLCMDTNGASIQASTCMLCQAGTFTVGRVLTAICCATCATLLSACYCF